MTHYHVPFRLCVTQCECVTCGHRCPAECHYDASRSDGQYQNYPVMFSMQMYAGCHMPRAKYCTETTLPGTIAVIMFVPTVTGQVDSHIL